MYLAFDVGLRRTGVANTDSANILASPADVLEHGEIAVEALSEAILHWIHEFTARNGEQPEALVLGMPDAYDERARPVCDRVRHLGRILADRTGLPVHYQDEQFSSRTAVEVAGTRKKRRDKSWRNAVAAAVILESFLTSS